MTVKTTKQGEARAARRSVSDLDPQALHQRIAERAYFHFLDRGQIHGHDWEDWFMAEREVLSEFRAQSRAEAPTIPGKRTARPQQGRKRPASSDPGTL